MNILNIFKANAIDFSENGLDGVNWAIKNGVPKSDVLISSVEPDKAQIQIHSEKFEIVGISRSI